MLAYSPTTPPLKSTTTIRMNYGSMFARGLVGFGGPLRIALARGGSRAGGMRLETVLI